MELLHPNTRYVENMYPFSMPFKIVFGLLMKVHFWCFSIIEVDALIIEVLSTANATDNLGDNLKGRVSMGSASQFQ